MWIKNCALARDRREREKDAARVESGEADLACKQVEAHSPIAPAARLVDHQECSALIGMDENCLPCYFTTPTASYFYHVQYQKGAQREVDVLIVASSTSSRRDTYS